MFLEGTDSQATLILYLGLLRQDKHQWLHRNFSKPLNLTSGGMYNANHKATH